MGKASSSQRGAKAADYNARILWPLARYVEDRMGAGALREIAAAAGIQTSDLDGGNSWMSAEQFERFLATIHEKVGGDEAFKRACTYRIAEAYGPLRYVLWALDPGLVYGQGAKQFRLMSTSGELSLAGQGRTWAHLSFRSKVPFSRINCLVRQAQGAVLPTFWGLPPAHVKETACIGRGDPTCELHYHWYVARRWTPVFVGALLFAAVGFALFYGGLTTLPTPVAMAIFGALLGYVLEVRRAERLNEHTREEVVTAVRELAHGEADARRELLEMHSRQKGWTRLVEEEMTARAAAIEKVFTGVQELQSARATTVLGFSHDLRNPLQMIQMSLDYLQDCGALKDDASAVESVGDIRTATDRMRRMLGELVQVTKGQRDFVTMEPQRIETAPLAEGLQRRMRALVYGRDIRATVIATREAPETIEMDPLALDRILDNLMTNAAKYTERGSVTVELDGSPGFLVVKVADTGCGIPPDALGRIFTAGGSDPSSRKGDSFGVGLSVVVQLLEQIGGRLEISSKPDTGTTFWVYLPVTTARESGVARTSPPAPATGEAEHAPGAFSSAGGLSRVVRIRNVPA